MMHVIKATSMTGSPAMLLAREHLLQGQGMQSCSCNSCAWKSLFMRTHLLARARAMRTCAITRPKALTPSLLNTTVPVPLKQARGTALLPASAESLDVWYVNTLSLRYGATRLCGQQTGRVVL